MGGGVPSRYMQPINSSSTAELAQLARGGDRGLRYFYRSLQRARLAVQQRDVMNALLPADISNSAAAYYF